MPPESQVCAANIPVRAAGRDVPVVPSAVDTRMLILPATQQGQFQFIEGLKAAYNSPVSTVVAVPF